MRIRYVPLLALLFFTVAAHAQSPDLDAERTELTQLTESFSDLEIVYAGDYRSGVGHCNDQRLRAVAAIEAFATHPRIESAVFSDWDFGRGSFSGAQEHEARAIFFRQLIAYHQALQRPATSYSCPDRGPIRALAQSLYRQAARHIELFGVLDESPMDVVGYLAWRGKLERN